MNEETRLINPGFEGQTNQESENPQAPLMPEKKGVSTGTIVAGVAGGGVVGAAAAAGAAYLYDQSNSDEEVAVVEGEGEALAETAPEAVAEAPVQHVYHETVHVVHDNPQPHHHQQHAHEAHATQTSNHISGGTHTEVGDGPTTGGTVEESDVHVIGVDVVDNGQGGEAVVAYMEDRVDGQLAAVVDYDSDGTIDVLAVDENGNQHFEENEIHDVSGEGIQTMAYIESYAQEQGIGLGDTDNGTTMAGYEEPDMGYTGEQDYYTAMDDTTADYVNDADTGLYEA